MKAACGMLLLLCSTSFGAYHPEEMCVIGWGSEPEKLRIGLPTYEDVNFTPADSSDDYIDAGGPEQGVVDPFENIYIASSRFKQLKGFARDGRIIVDYSAGTPNYSVELFKSGLRRIYVDSICHIYIVDGMRYDYVAVVDTAGHLIDKLSPHGQGSGTVVKNIHFNSQDILTFYLLHDGYYTYNNGAFSAGGAMGWKSIDGAYYNANLMDSMQIKFIKYSNPDLSGTAADLQESAVTINGPIPYKVKFLGVDDEMNLYIYLEGPVFSDQRVQIYDISYDLLDEIFLQGEPNRYLWYMPPFMRPSDGNIYEFRCLDDGLHVIRWSRQ